MIPAQPKIFWSFVAVAALSASVQAQPESFESQASRLGKEAVQQAQAQRAGMGHIHETLVGMRDAVGVGETVADYIERNPNISIEFGQMKGLADTSFMGGSMPLITITLNKELPRYPRVLAIPITAQAFDLMYNDMPDSVEKAYMKASMVARAFVELGGDKNGLPEIEPLVHYKNDELAAMLREWLGKSSGTVMAELENTKGLKSLDQLQAENERDLKSTDPHTKVMAPDMAKRLQRAQDTFTRFLSDEHTGEHVWRQMYEGRY